MMNSRGNEVSGGEPVMAMAAVAVAVKSASGRGSRRAVLWAVENLMHKADRLVLVHVVPTITSVPSPSGGSIPIKELDASVVEMYIQDMKAKFEERFLTFKNLYRKQKIEILIIEGGNPALAILSYISDSRITSLVLGSYSSNYFARNPKDSEVPTIVLKRAPDSCNVYVVAANKIISNSLNPLLTNERGCDSLVLTTKESSLSSSTESKYQNCLSDVTHPHSQTQTPSFSLNSGAAQETDHQVLEDNLSDIMKDKEFQSISSACFEQLDVVAEVEQLCIELDNTLSLYNQACADLVHAQREVWAQAVHCCPKY